MQNKTKHLKIWFLNRSLHILCGLNSWIWDQELHALLAVPARCSKLYATTKKFKRKKNCLFLTESKREWAERGKHRIWNRLQVLSCQHRAQHVAWTQELWDDLSQSGMLSPLSHPGAPQKILRCLSICICDRESMLSHAKAGGGAERGGQRIWSGLCWQQRAWCGCLNSLVVRPWPELKLNT